MNKGFFADALASRPLLWGAMLRANARPAAVPRFPEASVRGLLGADAAPFLAWLTERAVEQRPPEGRARSGFWDYAEESRRLALLEMDTLGALCLVAGVALHAPEIARVLRREEVRALRRDIGEDLYHYALCRGQYQIGGVRRLFTELHPALPLAERCALHGSMAPRLVASRWPVELGERFFSKLPPLPEGVELPALEEKEIREVWFALKKLLLKEVAPSWASCFD